MAKSRQAQLWLTCASILVTARLFAADPAWLEYGPDGVLARTIVADGGECPRITIDGRHHEMRIHAAPAKGYQVTVCEAAIPAGATTASIHDAALPVAKLGRSTRVAILGDTGCRRKAGSPPQDCNDPKKWPFATIAASIAAWDPDVVIHVGDYYYREATTCSGSTCSGTTYDWSRWNKDFFTPAEPLLRNAPWIVARGNHEMCGRAAEGWVRFLDPHNYVWESNKTCNSNLTFTPPYRVTTGDVNLFLMDSSAAQESSTTQSAIYAAQLGLLAKSSPGTWLMLHHPLWAMDYTDPVTETLWTAWNQAGAATSSVALQLAGHIHLLEALSFTDHRVPVMVAGNGATSLDGPPTIADGTSIGGRTVSSYMVDDGFGFIAATKSATGWTFDVRDADGKSKTMCAVMGTGIVCD